MDAGLIQRLNLAWPGLVALLCLVAACLPDGWIGTFSSNQWFDLLSSLPALSWLKYAEGLPVRGVLLAAFLVLLIYAVARDYSQFFPQRFDIEVYFDEPGIIDALSGYTSVELKKLNILPDWHSAKASYFKRLNDRLADGRFRFRFSGQDGVTRGSGTGTLRGKRVEGWGFQRYRIVEGNGDLVLVTAAPNEEPLQLITKYELFDSRGNDIEPRLIDIILMRPMLVLPQFKQMIHRTAESKAEFDHVLCTATKIRFFPLIDIGITLYLVRDEKGFGVPIGYAVYSPAS